MSHVSGQDVSDLLTLVITTSPTPSAPSPELLCGVIEGFQAHCDVLLKCRVVVVFDIFEQIGSESRLKKGYVTPETAEKYAAYKQNVKELFLETFAGGGLGSTKLLEASSEAEFGSPGSTIPVPLLSNATEDGCITFIEAQERRLGFGLAVRSALRAVKTPYVWVHQHDWRLIFDIPIGPILGIMQDSITDESKPIKYVCLPSGRRCSYAISEQVTPYPELRKLSVALTGDYTPTSPSSPSGAQAATPAPSVPLTPMYFWHDKPHVAATSHYLSRVFPSRLAMMRGAFIEDTIGQRARSQMKEGQWTKWATWQYNPEDGKATCLRHLHGRTWRGEEAEGKYRSLAVLRGMELRERRSSASNSESN